jgi:hypothetical protein
MAERHSPPSSGNNENLGQEEDRRNDGGDEAAAGRIFQWLAPFSCVDANLVV